MLMPFDWEVPAIFRQRLGDRAGRQRVMQADGHLLLVLHKVPIPGVPEREGALFWRKPDGTWKTSGRGEGVIALRRHVEEFAAAVDKLELMYEKGNDAASYYRVIGAVVPLHRTASHLYSTLQSAREIMPDDRDLIDLRDRAGEVDRAAELLHTDALNAVNFSVAQRAEELSRSSHSLAVAGHRLNTLATLLLPITAVAGIFGMNLASGLENSGPLAFWVVFLLSIVIGLQLRFWLITRTPVSAPKMDDPDELLRSAGPAIAPKPTPEELSRLV